MTTVAPYSANSRAVAPPKPEAPPVTIAEVPPSSMSEEPTAPATRTDLCRPSDSGLALGLHKTDGVNALKPKFPHPVIVPVRLRRRGRRTHRRRARHARATD